MDWFFRIGNARNTIPSHPINYSKHESSRKEGTVFTPNFESLEAQQPLHQVATGWESIASELFPSRKGTRTPINTALVVHP